MKVLIDGVETEILPTSLLFCGDCPRQVRKNNRLWCEAFGKRLSSTRLVRRLYCCHVAEVAEQRIESIEKVQALDDLEPIR